MDKYLQLTRSHSVEDGYDDGKVIGYSASARIARNKGQKSDGVMKIVDEVRFRKDRGLGLGKSLYL